MNHVVIRPEDWGDYFYDNQPTGDGMPIFNPRDLTRGMGEQTYLPSLPIQQQPVAIGEGQPCKTGTDIDIRLECYRLANGRLLGSDFDIVLQEAKAIYEWVTRQDSPREISSKQG